MLLGRVRVANKAEREISRGNQRELVARKAKPDEFTRRRQEEFLTHFAASCNVRWSAAAANVSPSTVYRRRRTDPAFKAAWAEAQCQGYAALEADLILQARQLLNASDHAREHPGEAHQPPIGMDAKLAFALLQNFQKNSGKEPGDINPRRSDLSEATRRLERAMRAMKLLPPPTAPAPTDGDEDQSA